MSSSIGKDTTNQQSPAAAAGEKAHRAKIALHHRQLQGDAGRSTAGLATSPGAPKVPNGRGKMYAKGKA